MTQSPEVSIIMPVHNEGALLYSTLEAIQKSTGVSAEIIVIDDESTDSCCDFLRSDLSTFDNVSLVTQKRAGISKSRNQGAMKARAAVLIFLDAHCYPQTGWVEALLDALDANAESIVAPCITNAHSSTSKGFGAKVVNGAFRYRWLKKTGDAPYDIPIAGGACMVIKKDFFNLIGGFDNIGFLAWRMSKSASDAGSLVIQSGSSPRLKSHTSLSVQQLIRSQ